jgi:hypothetical protein
MYARHDLSNRGGRCHRRDSFLEWLQFRWRQLRRRFWRRRDRPEFLGAQDSGITEEWNGYRRTGPGDVALLKAGLAHYREAVAGLSPDVRKASRNE